VLDKSYSFEIDGVRRQYSGNAHGVGTGIGIVNLNQNLQDWDSHAAFRFRVVASSVTA